MEHHHHLCAAASPLLANASSSASVLLHTPARCRAAPFEVLLRQEGSTIFSPLSQWASHLPLEVSVPQCEHGCYLRLQSLDSAQLALRFGSINASAATYDHALNFSVVSDESERIATPPPPVLAPHPPAARLEMMLRPPLSVPFPQSGSSWTQSLVHVLHNEHFKLRQQRVQCVEVSSTGSFLILDVVPEDIFAYVSGPDVAEVPLAGSTLIHPPPPCSQRSSTHDLNLKPCQELGTT